MTHRRPAVEATSPALAGARARTGAGGGSGVLEIDRQRFRALPYETLCQMCDAAGVSGCMRKIVLRCCRGESDRQIALRLKCSQRTVEQLLDRAIRLLDRVYPSDPGCSLGLARQLVRCVGNRSDKTQDEKYVSLNDGIQLRGRPSGAVADDVVRASATVSPGKFFTDIAKRIKTPLHA